MGHQNFFLILKMNKIEYFGREHKKKKITKGVKLLINTNAEDTIIECLKS